MHLEYSHVNDRNLAPDNHNYSNLAPDNHNYNLVDVELDFRF